MMRISIKALLGAGSLAAIAAFSLAPGAQAQCSWSNSAFGCSGQPTNGTAEPQPGALGPNGQTTPVMPPQNGYAPQQASSPAPMPQNGMAPQPNAMEQNASVPADATQPSQFHQLDPRYPGPKLN
jgi:hypothetical protein